MIKRTEFLQGGTEALFCLIIKITKLEPTSSDSESNDAEDSDRTVKSFEPGQWRYLRGHKAEEKNSGEIKSVAVDFLSPTKFDSSRSTISLLTVTPSLESQPPAGSKELSTDAGENIMAGEYRGDECSSVDHRFPQHDIPGSSSHVFTKDQHDVAQTGNDAVRLDSVNPFALNWLFSLEKSKKCNIEHEKTDRSQASDVHRLQEARAAEQSDEHEVVKVMQCNSKGCSPYRKLVSHCDSDAPKQERKPISLKIHDMKENAASVNWAQRIPIGVKIHGKKDNVASGKVEKIGNATVPKNFQRPALKELQKN